MTTSVDDQIIVVADGVTREQFDQALRSAGIRGLWSIHEDSQPGFAFNAGLFYPNDNFDEIVAAVQRALPVRVATLLELDAELPEEWSFGSDQPASSELPAGVG